MHKHRFRTWAHTGPTSNPTICFRCTVSGCREEVRQPASPELTAQIQADLEDINLVHKTWHAFTREFMTESPLGEWKLQGYALMEAIEKWAVGYPDEVKIVGVDDDVHSGSILVLVEHKSPSQYFGVTMVSVPQNSGPPCIMFMYPEHQKGLMGVLTAMSRGSVPIKRTENQKKRESMKLFQREKYRG